MSKIRQHIVVTDLDGAIYFHGIAISPPGMSYLDAFNVVTAAHTRVVKHDPDEWNYGDVMEEITRLSGWDVVQPNDTNHGLWEESVDARIHGKPASDNEKWEASTKLVLALTRPVTDAEEADLDRHYIGNNWKRYIGGNVKGGELVYAVSDTVEGQQIAENIEANRSLMTFIESVDIEEPDDDTTFL